ncbi:MAG: alkaline phosphatase [Rhizorhabdus sp.]|nr:alkaline phosphatase [Rhizorhabdus sp.]
MTISITRRSLIAGAGAGAGLLAAPAIIRAQQVYRDYPFRLGIASGEPSADGFVIWTRLAPDPLDEHGGMPMQPVEVDWIVYDDPGRKTIVQQGKALARPELGHAVHVEISGLQPDRPYWYRFLAGRDKTVLGRTRTMPRAGASLDRIRFGVAGCQHYEDGLFTAYRHLAAEDVSFVWHYGDYIYEDRAQQVRMERDGSVRPHVRDHVGSDCYSLGDYRRRYAQYKGDPDLQMAHSMAPWFVTFDDHEVADNWTGQTTPKNPPPEVFALRRAAAFQAYYEHMPLRKASFPVGSAMQSYRRSRFGDLLDVHFLDTRQYRSPIACSPDDFVPYCAAASDPQASVLGTEQEKWLTGNLHDRKARWNLLAQQVMMMRLDRRPDDAPAPTFNFDSWAGYDVPRERMLGELAGLGNVVVMTGDEHQNFAGELRRKNGQGEAVAVELVATSISSGGSGGDKKAGADKVMADNPFLKFSNNQRGYMLCDLTPDLWQGRYRVVDQVHESGGSVSTRATANIERGKPAIDIG